MINLLFSIFLFSTCFAGPLIGSKAQKRLYPFLFEIENHLTQPEIDGYYAVWHGDVLIYKDQKKEDLLWDLDIYKKYIQPEFIVIDIGANVGTNAIHMAKFAYHGIVIAFEMHQPYCQFIITNAINNNIKNLIISHSMIGNDLCEIASYEYEYILRRIPIDYLKIKRVGFIRINTKNSMEVLRGCRKTILKCRPTLAIKIKPNNHLPKINIKSKQWGKLEISSYLKKLNYSIKEMANDIIIASPNY